MEEAKADRQYLEFDDEIGEQELQDGALQQIIDDYQNRPVL